MKQKITITSASPADNWPKVVNVDSIPLGTAYYIAFFNGQMGLYDGDDKCALVKDALVWCDCYAGKCVCFENQHSAVRWYSDPQPIEEPKTLTFGELNYGVWFATSQGIFMKTEPVTQSNEIIRQAVGLDGTFWTFYDHDPVTRCEVVKEGGSDE